MMYSRIGMLRKEIIKEYVASLKEDGELDYIFPLLLERMGFRILSTPRQSKGQSQYGRDVVATKKVKGKPTLFLFELKGFSAHDITDRTLSEPDGLIESLTASLNTPYRDASITSLKDYDRRFVFVHNGTVDENARPTLDGFVERMFPDKNFERWDINKLTELFSKYLFEETLLTDEDSYRLLKRALVLLDSEGNDYSDLVQLVNLQISKLEGQKQSKRTETNFFATIRLIGALVYYYSIQADNLYPAKYCMDTIVLKTWAWILRNKLEKKKRIIELYRPLVTQQLSFYEAYLNKVIDAAGFEKGFYSFKPSDTEYIFYPLRCFDFLGDLMYYFFTTEYFGIKEDDVRLQKTIVKEIINNNTGFKMPLLDTHSIPIQLVFLYLMRDDEEEDGKCMTSFVVETVVNLIKLYQKKKMWPELTGNRMALAKSLYKKSDDYCCDSSLLVVVIFELIAYLGLEQVYSKFREVVEESGVNLQIAFPIQDEYDIEQCLFDHRLYEEVSVQTNVKLPKTLEEFRSSYYKPYDSIAYRTDAAGFNYLRILAHKYYETDLFPDFLGRAYCKNIE